MRKLMAAAAILIAMSGTLSARAQAYDPNYYARLPILLQNIVDAAQIKLAPADRTLLPSIHVRPDPHGVVNAFARESAAGRREITVYLGLLYVIDQLSQVAAVQMITPACNEDYLRYLYQTYFLNGDRMRRGLQPDAILTLAGYLQRRQECSGTLNALMNLPPELTKMEVEFIETSMVMVFLHELAHHQLGHVDRRGPTSLAMSRDEEAAADAWALQRLPLIKGYIPAALPFFLHMTLTNGTSLEDEAGMDHPLGARRMIVLLDTSIPTIADPAIRSQLLTTRNQLAAATGIAP